MQFEPLLLPKLQLPRLQKSLLPRERLLELLDKAVEHKLTLISGPVGYGKTTLIGQWIAERGNRMDFPQIACVTLDEGDNDPIRFWRYVIAACQQFRAGFGKEAQDLLLAHRLPPFKPLEMMLTALLNELSQLEHPAVLILDDFHAISSYQVIETLSFFLDHLPTSFHLIILIRGDPPFSLARLRARNELLDIYPPHLGFSLEETRAFFNQELSFAQTPLSFQSHQLAREVQATLARIQLASGDLAPVRRWFERHERSEEVVPLLQRQREQLLHARLFLAQQEIAAAIDQLESLHVAATQTGHIYFDLQIQVVLALSYFRQRLHEKAWEHLRDVLEMTHSEGHVRLFLDEGEELADLLRELLPHLHEKVLLAYVRRLLSAFPLENGGSGRKTTPGAILLLEPLSPQEQKVLRLLAAGNSNAEIARELVVSVNTVRTQVQSIYRKLNVNNRVEASTVAKQLELL